MYYYLYLSINNFNNDLVKINYLTKSNNLLLNNKLKYYNDYKKIILNFEIDNIFGMIELLFIDKIININIFDYSLKTQIIDKIENNNFIEKIYDILNTIDIWINYNSKYYNLKYAKFTQIFYDNDDNDLINFIEKLNIN